MKTISYRARCLAPAPGISRLTGWGVLTLLLLSTCAKPATETVDLNYGYDYYPLAVGRSWTYEVDSILYREGRGEVVADSTRTLVREVVTDSLPDNTGQVLYTIERYERRRTEDPWTIRAVWTASRSGQQAFRTEDNLRFIKLVFPVRAGREWNGNAYLPVGLTFPLGSRQVEVFKEWRSSLSEVGRPAKVGDLRFDDVATVELADFETAIELRRAVEQYARGVGLVYREWMIFDTQCTFCCSGDIGAACQAIPWRERVENGLLLRQRLIDYQ